jgi:hypothetical protein
LISTEAITKPPISNSAARKSFALVFCCTLIGALAQILVKKGSEQLGAHITLGQVAHDPSLFVSFSIGIITNLKLFMGYTLYGVNTFLMALALKGREVWVTFLSLFVLPGEHLNFFRVLGIIFIVVGVSVLGLKK